MPKLLRVGLLAAPEKLDPATAEHETQLVLHQLLETPFAVAPAGGELEPALFAGPLERLGSGEPAVYRARLRPGAAYSDGAPVTPQQVAATLRQAPTVREQALVTADEAAVTFTLKRPNGRFDLSLSHVQCSVLRPRAGWPLGSGPFQVAPDSRPGRLRLVPNPHSPRRPLVDELLFEAFPPEADGRPLALLQAFERGQVDATTALQRDQAAQLKGVRRALLPGLSTAVLYLNVERLRDARLRRALAHAVDRELLASEVYANALVFTARSLLPRGLAPGLLRDALGHDPARARALWVELGAAVPRRLSLLIPWAPRPYLPNPRRSAELLAEQWAPLGLAVEVLRPATAHEYLERLVGGQQDLVLGGWTADTTDPCDFLEANLASERVPARANLAVAANSARLRSPALDRALADYRAERSPARLEAVQRLVDEEAPLVPLFFGSTSLVHTLRVTGLKPSPLSLVDFSRAELLGD